MAKSIGVRIREQAEADRFLKSDDAIFKYAPFNHNTLKILINNELWFGEAKNQNDPFEGEFLLKSKKKISEDIAKMLLERILPDLKQMGDEEYLNESSDYSELIRSYQETIRLIIKEVFGICSFSKSCDNILLWTHYTNAYNGLCFVFDKNKLEDELTIDKDIYPTDIKYVKKVPTVKLDFLKNVEMGVNGIDVLKCKYINFKYEDEFRFIKFFKNSLRRNIKFEPSTLMGIILGENMNGDDSKTIMNLIRKNDHFKHVTLFRAKKDIETKKIVIKGVFGPISNTDYPFN